MRECVVSVNKKNFVLGSAVSIQYLKYKNEALRWLNRTNSK